MENSSVFRECLLGQPHSRHPTRQTRFISCEVTLQPETNSWKSPIHSIGSPCAAMDRCLEPNTHCRRHKGSTESPVQVCSRGPERQPASTPYWKHWARAHSNKKNKKNEGKMITTFNKHHHGLLRIPGPAGTTNDLLRVKRQIYIYFFIFIIVPNAFLLPKPASQRKHCSPIGNVYPHPLSHPLQRAAQSSLLWTWPCSSSVLKNYNQRSWGERNRKINSLFECLSDLLKAIGLKPTGTISWGIHTFL